MSKLVSVTVITVAVIVVAAVGIALFSGCADPRNDSADVERQQQETLTGEALSQTGMPAIQNFRERKLVKDIYELRDQEGLTTYTYLWNEYNGRLIYFGETVGYGIPYAAQYSASLKRDDRWAHGEGSLALPQPEPNGLYLPESAEGTWVLLKDPNGDSVKPVYVEPRIVVSPFKLSELTR